MNIYCKRIIKVSCSCFSVYYFWRQKRKFPLHAQSLPVWQLHDGEETKTIAIAFQLNHRVESVCGCRCLPYM